MTARFGINISTTSADVNHTLAASRMPSCGRADAASEGALSFAVARLRRVALRLPGTVVRKAVADMRRRAQAIVDVKGGNIPRD